MCCMCVCVCSQTHWLAVELLSVTQLDVAVEPHSGHLVQPLEAERVELEGGAAVLGVVKYGDRVVRRTAGKRAPHTERLS